MQSGNSPESIPSLSQDEQHLSLLAVFHYVLALIVSLCSMVPLIHLTIGIAMVSGLMKDDRGNEPPEFLGWMLIFIAAFIILGGLLFAVFIFMTGRRLSKRKGYRICIFIAGLECVFMPLGTALGVFTIIVLMRPSVKALFGLAPPVKPS